MCNLTDLIPCMGRHREHFNLCNMILVMKVLTDLQWSLPALPLALAPDVPELPVQLAMALGLGFREVLLLAVLQC